MIVVAAAFGYFLTVFAVGFLLGPIRVLLLEPRLGPVGAVLCEAPFLLAAMVVAARWVPRRLGLAPTTGGLTLTGLGAVLLLIASDVLVGFQLRGMGLAAQLAKFTTAEGWIYAALLLLFAVMPWLANRAGE
jgi:hypothetical protein